jgi:ABC-type multidrug transport system ATPase subunit
MDLRRRLAFLPDFPVAFPQNTVLRHIGMVLRLYGADEAAVEPRVLELLRGFDLWPLIDMQMGEAVARPGIQSCAHGCAGRESRTPAAG